VQGRGSPGAGHDERGPVEEACAVEEAPLARGTEMVPVWGCRLSWRISEKTRRVFLNVHFVLLGEFLHHP
jgi:hypothetical protein